MSGELRAVLTEAIKAHKPTTKRINHPRRQEFLLNLDACMGCEWTEQDGGDHDSHVADVIASLPGVAVIQLPDEMTDRTNVAEKIRHQPMWEHQGSWAMVEGGEVEFEADHQNVCGVIPANSVPGLISVLAAAAAAVVATEEEA